MTEEERQRAEQLQPRQVTNQTVHGKMKFLQKYYHRGAFFQNEEDELYKRDITVATGEDVIDKTILPKVMQVKNFGRRSRTKYTHLVDQDTTLRPARAADAQAGGFQYERVRSEFGPPVVRPGFHAAMKQSFERPSAHKRKR